LSLSPALKSVTIASLDNSREQPTIIRKGGGFLFGRKSLAQAQIGILNAMFTMSKEEFERLVEEGIEALDPKYHESIRNIAVVVEDHPTAHHRKVAGLKPGWVLYGLYEGIPLPRRGESYMFTLPDKISIFRASILEVAQTLEEARMMVKNTVWHEFGHYFGLNESEVRGREIAEGRDRS
jgi:predicted Zn-dependent protease with MMP-like domain